MSVILARSGWSHGGAVRQLRGTVLVVDDEKDVVDGMSRALRHAEYRVITALGPDAALEVLGRERVDVIVTDLLMPGMDGLEFLDLVRDRHPEVVRIILTGHPDAETAIAAINQEEVYRYLTKPVSRDQLLVTLHLAFERQAEEREVRRLAAEARSHDCGGCGARQVADALEGLDAGQVQELRRALQAAPGPVLDAELLPPRVP